MAENIRETQFLFGNGVVPYIFIYLCARNGFGITLLGWFLCPLFDGFLNGSL